MGKPVQDLVIHLLVNALIRKNPDLPFKEGEKEEDPCIFLCLVEPFLKETPFSPHPDRLLFSSDSDKEPLQCIDSPEEDPAREKEYEAQGNIGPDRGVEKKKS